MLLVYSATLACFLPLVGASRITAFSHPRLAECFGVLGLMVFARAFLHERKRAPYRVALSRSLVPALRVFRDFLPFFFYILLYEALHDLSRRWFAPRWWTRS